MAHYTFTLENSPFSIDVPGAVAPGLSTSHISPPRTVGLSEVQKHLNTVVITDPNIETGEVRVFYGLRDSVPVVHEGGRLEAYSGANLVTLTRPYSTNTIKSKGGGRRGKVQSFSKSARRRLLRLLATVEKKSLPVFITLTYPGEYPHEWKTWKRHLDTFCKRLVRRYPGCGLVWRIEPQKRGAPHYHLLVWNAGNVLHLRKWVADAWFSVVNSGDVRHAKAGTRTEAIRSSRGVMSYAAKYLGKLPDTPSLEDWQDGIGRWWGVRQAENIPWARKIVRLLPPDVVEPVLLALLHHAGLSEGQWRSLTVFGDGDDWLAYVANILNPPEGELQ